MTPQIVSVVINVVAGILLALVSFILKGMKERMDGMETTVRLRGETIASLTTRVGILETQFSTIQRALDRIENKLDAATLRSRDRSQD